MPPKAKYTREEMIEKALEIARREGIESVVARELGKALGTSSSPIFTAFRNMEEVQQEVRKAALCEFEAYVRDALRETPAFKHVGMRMIEFATKEPKLFQLLYMREHDVTQTYDLLIAELGETVKVCMDVLQRDYRVTEAEAGILFRQVWLHTFGICVLAAGRVCHFTEEEISDMLSMEFQGALMVIKAGGLRADLLPAEV